VRPRKTVARRRIDSSPAPAESWPASLEVDGYTYELGPDPADAEWAAANLNGDQWDADDPVPDHVYDERAAEAAALDALENGHLL
jgi:hypothetical protein